MSLKLISKNNIGAAAALILTVLLSQARVFDFLIDTVLGRMVLILFILGISYTNKIIGVVSVLIIIIMFNQSTIGLMEGFTADGSGNIPDSGNNPNIEKIKELINKDEKDLKDKKAELKKITEQNTDSSQGGLEGFNITDREGVILKGKKSNEVPVFSDVRNQNDHVEPADSGIFSGIFESV